jgi:hypothetical protein
MLKRPLLRFPSISLPKMSTGIKLLPLPECPQLKTIQATASTSFSCVGKRCVLIETRTYTGPWKTTRRRASRTQVSSQHGSCFSWLSSTYRRRQELNGLATLYVEVAPPLRMLLVRLSLSSWLGAYGSLSRQRSYISTLRCDRPQKLSSSSATFYHASCLWRRQSFGKLSQLLRSRVSI